MIKSIYFFVFLLMSFSAGAQITTNVYWTEKTSMVPGQTIYYSPGRLLQWDDFTGRPQLTGLTAAITMSGFGYQASMKTKGSNGEINISVYCYFNKPGSWVKPDKKTAYILNHEQHHFDISYLAARVFASRVKSLNLTPQNINVLLPKLYTECCDLMNKMQDDYDGQTKNGQLADMQEKWNTILQQRLADEKKVSVILLPASDRT